jgi:hypothetical protein
MTGFEIVQDFPARLDRLWSVFGRADYPRRKYLSMGATEVRLRAFRAAPTAIDVDLERDVPVDRERLPAWARAVAGSRQALHHVTHWRRIDATHATGELEIAAVGLPVHAQGAGAIAERADGRTRMTLEWQVSARLPVVGRALERLFADQLRQALDADHAFTLAYLRDAPGPEAA